MDDVRVIIAGSRTFNDYKKVLDAAYTYLNPNDNITIISGTAKGADTLGEIFADRNGLSLVKIPAKWDLYGKRAGYLRNEEMANYASEGKGILLAFWDGKSHGTKHMIQIAKRKGLEIHVILYGGNLDG